jgi:2-oxoglutarate dehydrogenase E1 component
MYVEKETDWLSSRWTGFKGPSQISRIRPTGNEMDSAQDRNPSRNVYRQIAKIFKARREMAKVSNGALPKALGFGSLLLEGNHVHITGQYVQSGTFSYRDAVVENQNTNPQGRSGAQQTSRYWGQ